MINPSANGWIDKFFLEKTKNEKLETNSEELYSTIRKSGFIFGQIQYVDLYNASETKGLLKNELSKIALLDALYKIYCLNKKTQNPKDFISLCISFYRNYNPENFNLLKKILPTNSPSENLEQIVNKRVQTKENILNKNFSHLVTNALLFVDVLAFQRFMIKNELSIDFFIQIENTIMSLVSLALKSKTIQSNHDNLLIKLLESSTRYSKFSEKNNQNIDDLDLAYFTNEFEKKYLIDLSGLALWSDGVIEKNELYFIQKLAETLNITDDFVSKSIEFSNHFITENKKQISFLNDTNPIKDFYEQTTQNIVKLIIRNKKRLGKEISESKELMVLLALSTRRDLDEVEKKKVKNQLMDICKTVPSLTIFLIPGGSLLLPILIKFIPQLLPSSFNENLNEEK
jgi:LETM1-like protein